MGGNFQLQSIYIVIGIFTPELHHLAFADKIKVSHTGYLSIVIFQTKYGISIFLVAVIVIFIQEALNALPNI